MVKAKIKGVNTVRKKLAGGTTKVYYYHRGTGTPLPGEPGDAAFLAAFTAAEQGQPKDVGNVDALIREYLLSVPSGRRPRAHRRSISGCSWNKSASLESCPFGR